MDESERMIRVWAGNTLDKVPIEIAIWCEEEEFIQVLIRYEDSVMIADLDCEDEKIIDSQHLEINVETWQPGSIQTRRMPDGLVRFRHRSNNIFLAAQVRAPDWARALLEGWLLEIRGNSVAPQDKRQRFSELRRKKETISRLLEQAELNVIQDAIAQTNSRLSNADDRLAGKKV